MAKRWASSTTQWFGCRACALAWHGGELPMDGKQYAAMFERNRFCVQCNRTTVHFGGFVPVSTTPITLFTGSISELQLAIRKDAA